MKPKPHPIFSGPALLARLVAQDSKPCLMEWHYGTVGPLLHTEPNGASAWKGYHGAPTTNASRICDECAADWRLNYPGYDLPDVTDAMALVDGREETHEADLPDARIAEHGKQ